MPKLSRIFRLTAQEWGLLLSALALVWLVRIGLWLLPFRLVRESVTRVARPRARRLRRVTPQQMVWAVRRVSRIVPRATCLTQALATRILFGRQGWPAQVHIGGRRAIQGGFEAHAWLECEGRVVLGRVPDLETFSRFGGFTA